MTRTDFNATHPLQDVMALAVMAQRINNDYLTHDESVAGVYGDLTEPHGMRCLEPHAVKRYSNKNLMRFGMGYNLPNKLTDEDGNPLYGTQNVADEEDLEQAQEIISYYQGLMLKALSSQVNSFEEKVLHIVQENAVSLKDFGILASLIKSYTRSVAREEVELEQRALSADSQHIGAIGDTVEIDLTIMRMNYIQKLDCHVVNGKDEKGNLVVFFTSKDKEFMDKEQVNIRARIKRQQVSSYHGGKETVLNYVKVV
jgi:hypothetical protein